MHKKDIFAASAIGFLVAVCSLIILQNPDIKQKVEGFVPYPQAALILFPVLSAIGIIIAGKIGTSIPVLFQAAKFALVGALNTFVDIGVLTIFLLASGINEGILYSVFKGVSFSAAVVNSYLWNKFWTFRAKAESPNAKNTGTEFAQFLGVSIIGFFLNVGTASLVVNVIGPQCDIQANLWAVIGAVVGTLVVLTWNFFGYKLIVFKNKTTN